VWEDRIDRLDAHLQTLQQVAPDNRRPKDHD
jgi:hypothetical protein